ncbi:U3 small nucleolar RNA-associated protein 4 homolog [Teleopsis dalmanni]|uniref:U3 small nucleolar RNA-associated protein 4 homolog n=1 Tax=Teleopsis dalmanni TaxID=139649 RepID=UPI0018CF17A2|nr:U3 small nucleolar RNA-associated protein 4 homolog [Teleopsis dalmanni]
MKMNNKEHKGKTKIHNVRFYNLTPRAIQNMAYNNFLKKLALSRNDGSIEIWDMQYMPLLERTIPTTPGNSVEGMVWVGERLFSVGLSGEIVEWDLQKLVPRRKQYVTGNAIWCIDVNVKATQLAVGTEEGYVNIFDVENDEMDYKNLFDKQEGRVLCCKFDHSGEYLVTGSVCAIRIWNVSSGHAIHKMTVRSDTREVIVWCLRVLKDFTIISGDSRGIVTVWDGRTATEIETHQMLKADVLTLTTNEDETMLMCSGIEPIIRIYSKTLIKRDEMEYHRWVKFLQRSVHDHDVKALICMDERIISGGMDGYLSISSAVKTSSTMAKYGPFLQGCCSSIAPKKRLLLLRYTDYLEVWSLGSTNGEYTTTVHSKSEDKLQRQLLRIDESPKKNFAMKSKDEARIICATISPNAKWICYSTITDTRLFRFKVDEKGADKLHLIENLPEQFCAASLIHFSTDSKRLYLVSSETQSILVFAILKNNAVELEFITQINTKKHIKDNINLLEVSEDDKYIVAAGLDHSIAIWSEKEKGHYKYQFNLPKYIAATTAIALHADYPCLVATFSDGRIIEYNIEEIRFTCSEQNDLLDSARTHCTTKILLDRRCSDLFVLLNEENVYALKKYLNDEIEPEIEPIIKKQSKKHKKQKSVSLDQKTSGLRMTFSKNTTHSLNLSWLTHEDLVVVGMNAMSLIDQLPSAFKQKKFGSA